ncbi:DUF4350 domain-containing protein [Kitasatospora sp. NBC_00240]|uniref:DUF4350 domain-containing protein n=1 Tax=Kitasatospora sp. NBC_00240 TaxID=2903567 RepID=UPI002253802E|nr:DUF4350 domain-containing protein [Kitasatospora sp. NBC_00240]MCX5212625.1 DUF4350 domain-containing protein [Kitasatospora sp. NBC_00240]
MTSTGTPAPATGPDVPHAPQAPQAAPAAAVLPSVQVPAQGAAAGPVDGRVDVLVGGPADGSAGNGPGTSLTPTSRALWLRSRWFLLAGAVLLVTGLLLAGLKGEDRYPPLDPRSTDPGGTHAVVRLLEQQGLSTGTTGEPATPAVGAETFVVPEPDRLTADQLRALAAARHSRLVLIAPSSETLDALAPAVTPSGEGDLQDYVAPATTSAACSQPDAVRAGSAQLGGLLYRPGPKGTGCYPRHNAYPLVQEPTGPGTDVVVLGSGAFLTNDRIDEEGNAALALGLLGSRPRLTWLLPDYSAPAPADRQKQLTDFIPEGWYWAGLQLAVAALLAAAWRGRRLGPVVAENLPVVVRAAETTEGRARLYRRAKARGRAAEALRRAASTRLAPVLGVPSVHGAPDPVALCAAVADRLAGDSTAAAVQFLLYGPAPTDDAALLRLADDLDALERQVRQP